jgi:hypothetical protein
MRSAASPRDLLDSGWPGVSRIPLGPGEWMTACPPDGASVHAGQLRRAASAFLATRGPRPAAPALLPAGSSAFGDQLGTVVAHADHDGVVACYYEPGALHGSVARALTPVLSRSAARSLRIDRVPAREMPYPGQSMIVALDNGEVTAYVTAELIMPALAAVLPQVLAAATTPPRILAAP